MPELGVNIDHVATIREARKIDYPDPAKAALLSQEAGADSIVCHLREDRRHIRESDLYNLKKLLKVKLNLEMATSDEIVDIALDVKPDQITLVPEKREELTTEGGLDVVRHEDRLKSIVAKMQKAGIGVSFFIEPEKEQLEASMSCGVSMVELHTGRYANAKDEGESGKEYAVLKKAALHAKELGLSVFAGHGLNYENTKRLTSIKEIGEYNIGHSIVARAVFVGMTKAVKEMKAILT